MARVLTNQLPNSNNQWLQTCWHPLHMKILILLQPLVNVARPSSVIWVHQDIFKFSKLGHPSLEKRKTEDNPNINFWCACTHTQTYIYIYIYIYTHTQLHSKQTGLHEHLKQMLTWVQSLLSKHLKPNGTTR